MERRSEPGVKAAEKRERFLRSADDPNGARRRRKHERRTNGGAVLRLISSRCASITFEYALSRADFSLKVIADHHGLPRK